MKAQPEATGKESVADLLARHNPVLREFFSRQYRGLGLITWADDDILRGGESRPGVRMFDEFIDRQVDQYIRQLSGKLRTLKDDFADAVRARREAVAGTSGVLDAEQQIRLALANVAKDAKEIRAFTEMVLVNMPTRDHLVVKTGLEADPETGLRLLGDEIKKVEKRINDFFLAPTHLVDLEELKGENLLVHLRRVESISRKIIENL